MASPQKALHRGIIKQVLSGDTVVLRGQPKGGPPPEKTVCLSNINAPKLARRANPNTNTQESKDEPFAWEAREFLRKKLIGKEVIFKVEYKAPGNDREFGCIYLGRDTTGENMTEALITEGLVTVRRGGIRTADEEQQRLITLEDAAKLAQKGVHNTEAVNSNEHVRNITWNIENPRHFVDSHHNKPIDAVIEHVRDGCTVRAFLLPSFHHVTVMLSGIKCPMFKWEGDEQVPEEYAREAQYFTESRLLQKDVQIILEGVSNQNLLGTVLHPNGNIAEFLLNEGFARCVDWSMGVVTQGPEKLRKAEKVAKEKKLRLWKDYTPSTQNISAKEENFVAKVVEIVNGDAMILKMSDGKFKKIFLASIRPPRMEAGQDEKRDPKARVRPLYDIPHMFEAREFMRKKLIGKKVQVHVDYIQPPAQGFPEKCCCTVKISNINIAEALVSKGLCRVIRYRQDDDSRSSCYDDLLSAESRAEKKAVGLHSKKEYNLHRVADVSGEKSKQFLSFLQRAGRCEGIVEFVASGSRCRIYIPRETCLITLLLSGIECPRGARPGPGGVQMPADPYGDKALAFTKEHVLQREVEVEVESTDKGGNFIGWLYVDNKNMSLSLVQEGLSKVHFTAERSSYYSQLCIAEEEAKTKKLNVWANYEQPKEISVESEPKERKVNFKNVVVTDITDDLHFFVQEVEKGPQLEKLTEDLRQEFETTPPLPGSYTPKRGDLCAAKFSVDNNWYRAKIEKIDKDHTVTVLFVDYGNREIVSTTALATLPSSCAGLEAQAKEYALACVSLPEDTEDVYDAVQTFSRDVLNKTCKLNVEYRTTIDCVTLQNAENDEDFGLQLVTEGYVTVDQRKERRLAGLAAKYNKAQDKAKADRVNLWQYGDFTQDDAKEFGYQK